MENKTKKLICNFFRNYDAIERKSNRINEEYKTNYSWQYNIFSISGVAHWTKSPATVKMLICFLRGESYNWRFGYDHECSQEIFHILTYGI